MFVSKQMPFLRNKVSLGVTFFSVYLRTEVAIRKIQASFCRLVHVFKLGRVNLESIFSAALPLFSDPTTYIFD